MSRTVRRALISGIWAIRQVDTNGAWTQAVQDELTTAYNLSPMAANGTGGAVRGISIRTKASTLTTSNGVYDDTLFNSARTLANTLGCRLSVRFMCGVHTPAFVYDSLGARFWYGGNGASVKTGMNMTSGSAVLTGPAASFSSGMVNNYIIVYGAGASGGDLVARVSSYQSATQITLNTNASTTVSGQTACWNSTGARAPHPRTVAGGTNTAFTNWYDALVSHFKSWCVTNSVNLFHLSWFSDKYAEPFGNENHIAPVPGYTANGDGWRSGMQALIDVANTYADTNVTMEFASSGTYSAIPSGLSPVLSYAAGVFGNFSSKYYIQENGIAFNVAANQYHGLGNANTSRGGQMYIGGNWSAADWASIRTQWQDADNLDYLEVYTNPSGGSTSFTGTGAAGLKATSEAWYATLVEPTSPPTPITPVDLGRTLPGPAGMGLDGKVYVVERASATHAPAVYSGTGTSFQQISDAFYASNAALPLSVAASVDGTVYVATQGQGVLVGETPGGGGGGEGEIDPKNAKVEAAFGIPPLQVPADSDWVDLTARLRAFHSSRGRQHELDQTTAGTAQATLSNLDRALDQSNAASPYAGQIVPMTQVRVTSNGSPRFYGYAEDWRKVWPTGPVKGGKGDAIVELSLVDGFKVLSLAEANSYPAAVLDNAPALYYRINDSADATENPGPSILNYGSVQQDPLTGQPFTLHVDTAVATLGFLPSPLASKSTAIDLDGGATVSPMVIDVLRRAGDAWYADAWDFWIYPTALANNTGIAGLYEYTATDPPSGTAWQFLLQADGSVTLKWSYGGTLYSTASPAALLTTTDGWQHVACSITASGAFSWYRNGDLFGSSPALPQRDVQHELNLAAVVLGAATKAGVGFQGRLAHFAVYRGGGLSASAVANHFLAGCDEIQEGTAGEQIEQLLDAAGWPAGLRIIDQGSTKMQAFTPNGSVLAAILNIAETTERGLFQMTADGNAIFHSRDNLLSSHVATVATFSDDPTTGVPYSNLVVYDDDSDLYTVVSATRDGGQVQLAFDRAARAQYGARTLPLSGLAFADDVDAANCAAFLLGRYRSPRSRPGTMLLRGAHGADVMAQILAREIHGDHVLILRIPPGGGAVQRIDASIEGLADTWTTGAGWETVYSLTPALSSASWVLGLSAIGIDTIMGW